jgi:hypothetical protein
MVPANLTISGYSNTTVYLDFLDRTQIDNLYPFVAVLPSGGIFIAYYNEARILDEVTFDTVKTLPNIPVSRFQLLSNMPPCQTSNQPA